MTKKTNQQNVVSSVVTLIANGLDKHQNRRQDSLTYFQNIQCS